VHLLLFDLLTFLAFILNDIDIHQSAYMGKKPKMTQHWVKINVVILERTIFIVFFNKTQTD